MNFILLCVAKVIFVSWQLVEPFVVYVTIEQIEFTFGGRIVMVLAIIVAKGW